MRIDHLEFKGHSCFTDDYVSCLTGRPLTVIIGRNNAGKSRLLDLVGMWGRSLTDLRTEPWTYRLSIKLRVDDVPAYLPGAHGAAHVSRRHVDPSDTTYSSLPFQVIYKEGSVREVVLPTEVLANVASRGMQLDVNAIRTSWEQHLRHQRLPGASTVAQVSADRDIRPERKTQPAQLLPSGEGATNLIRALLVSEHQRRDLIRTVLLGALNEVFGEDGHFTEILAREDDADRDPALHTWEIFLGQTSKGLVRLSQSGSGIKTVILVLLQLLVVPVLERRPSNAYAFIFEELENNLHPAVLRRLMVFLEGHAVAHQTTMYLTTHSSVALDVLGQSDNVAVVQVAHDGTSARTKRVAAYFDGVETLALLGARPSDLLQANGVIWVEGPSDRIYLNAWLKLITDGRLKEGRDYACAYYAGSLLARVSFAAPGEEAGDLSNLLTINHNLALVADSDQVHGRAGQLTALKPRLQQAREAVTTSGGLVWITKGKEIESYWDGRILARMQGNTTPLVSPLPNELIFPGRKNTDAYVTRHALTKAADKVTFAAHYVEHADNESLDRLDLRARLEALVRCIDTWNGRTP